MAGEAVGRFTIRPLESPSEFKQVEAVQRAAWGMDPLEVVPAALLIAVAHEGGLVAGAFDGVRMVGFVFGFPTADPGRHHSHMLAVLPELRGTGLAARLKLFQRAWCLARGIRQVDWTFDPLMGLNARFNVHKLGCVVRRYLTDFYGPLSGINAGTPTDRFLAEWHLDSPRVRAAAGRLEADGRGAGQDPDEPDPGQLPLANRVEGGRPAGFALPDAPRFAVEIPGDFAYLLRHEPALAMQWRIHARELFTRCFEAHYAVVDFVRRGGRNFYVLERGTESHGQPEP